MTKYLSVNLFYFYVKRDRFDFCVNVKEFLCLFVTREKPRYFYVNQFARGYWRPSVQRIKATK